MYARNSIRVSKIVPVPPLFVTSYNIKFQNQKREEELGLNWDSFKWRNYDYSIGRFMSVDPLAEDYNFQSPYCFSSNRVIDHFELEGLEGEDFRFRQAMKANGGIQKNAEEYAERVNQEAFEVAFRIINPFEDLYGLITGKDFDGNNYNRGKALEMIALTAVPEVKAEAKAGMIVADKALSKAEARAAKLSEKARPGEVFTKAGKESVKDVNAIKNAGENVCESCGTKTTPSTQSKKGVTPAKTETNVDHINPKSKGGSGTPDNGQVLCRDCNIKKSNN